MHTAFKTLAATALLLAGLAITAAAQQKTATIGVSIPAATHGWTAGVIYHAERTKALLEKAYPGLKVLVKTSPSGAAQANALEDLTGQKQAAWRVDPERAGPGGALGDIGTHAFNLAEFVAGAEVTSVAADVHTFVAGRRLDDNAHILLRFAGGARGQLWCSQVAPGNDNGLRIRTYGEKGGLAWQQEQPNMLMFSPLGEPAHLISRNGPGCDPMVRAASRLPAGHPAGYVEAFAQLYADIAEQITARLEGRAPAPQSTQVPTVEHGLRGIRFIEAALRSSHHDGAWTQV
jgi:predicted dehydrogenase